MARLRTALPDVAAQTVAAVVAEVPGLTRGRLLTALAGRQAVVGPARPWLRGGLSYNRALRAHVIGLVTPNGTSVDTEVHLVDLVIGADPDTLADLRAQVLTPLADVAAALFVHPQTVRYRVEQLREVYGDRFDDPEIQLSAMIALS